MTAAILNRLVQDLGQSLAAERLGDLPDAELLRRFLGGDEAAFEAMVRRHGAAVLAAARAVLADEADVEDVFQASFLALWRGGRRIRKGTSLSSWLYGVGRRAALKALARSRRRRQVERRRPVRDVPDPADLSWREACQLLHEEIERLPEQYRGPIVLCHLEGRSRDEAAKTLGWKLDTLRGRLERGRDMLKRRLTRRGVALSAGLLAWLGGDTADGRELPVALISATVRTAGLVPADVPASVAALLPTGGPLLSRKIIWASIALVAVGLLSAGVGSERRGLPPPTSTGTSPVARLPDEPPAKPDESPAEKITLKGHVAGPHGKPVQRARLEAYRWNVGGRIATTADGGGRFTLELPGGKPARGDGSIRLVAAAPGFAPAVVEAPPVSADITVTMPEGTPLEGRILTLEGQPVAGAEVRIKGITAFGPGRLDLYLQAMRAARQRHPTSPAHSSVLVSRHAELLADLAAPATTDRDGRFRILNVGRDRLVELTVRGPTIQHVELLARTQTGAPIRVDHAEPHRPLGSFTVLPSPLEHLARPARTLRGTIRVKGTGKPVPGATVTADGTTAATVTDATGRYQLEGCPKGPAYNVIAVPPESASLFTAERSVSDTVGLAPFTVDVELLPGMRMSGRILDANTGLAVAGSVEYVPAVGNETLAPMEYLKRDADGTLHRARGTPIEAGADGAYSLVVAPGPGLLLVRADEQLYLDAYFDPTEAVPAQAPERPWRGDTTRFFTSAEFGPRMHAQHDYRAIVPINPMAGAQALRQDVRLTPATVVQGRFIDPDGKPLRGVWMRKMATLYWGNKISTELEADFEITGIHPKRPLTFYAVHTGRNLSGEFTVTGAETGRIEFRLLPAVTLSGRLVDRDGKPLAGYQIHSSRGVQTDPDGGGQYAVHVLPEGVLTDAIGRFRIGGLLPDRWHSLAAAAPGESGQPLGQPVAPLKPGATHDLGTRKFARQVIEYKPGE